jgi:hypothetical protein
MTVKHHHHEDLERMALVDLVAVLQTNGERMSEVAALVRGMAINEVLATEIAKLDGDGVWEKSHQSVAFGSVVVANYGSATVVVSNAPKQQGAPTGPGSYLVAPWTFQAINITGHSLSIYGLASQKCAVSIFTKPQPPVGGSLTVPSSSKPFAAGVTGVQLVIGPGLLTGFSVRETAGAAATMLLRDGTSNAGVILADVSLVANESDRDLLPDLSFATGLFLDRATGTTEGAAYVATLP